MAGEAPHVRLVDDGAARRPVQWRIALPIVGLRIHNHTLHRGSGVVTFQAGGFAAVAFGNNYAAAIRVEENFAGIEAQSGRMVGDPCTR